MALMAAGRTRPSVSQALLDRKPGACSLIEEITASKSPKTSQAAPLMNKEITGLRHEASISAVVTRCSSAGGETARETAGASVDGAGALISNPQVRVSRFEFRLESKFVSRNSSFERV